MEGDTAVSLKFAKIVALRLHCCHSSVFRRQRCSLGEEVNPPRGEQGEIKNLVKASLILRNRQTGSQGLCTQNFARYQQNPFRKTQNRRKHDENPNPDTRIRCIRRIRSASRCSQPSRWGNDAGPNAKDGLGTHWSNRWSAGSMSAGGLHKVR
jgi:hypothetical protein